MECHAIVALSAVAPLLALDASRADTPASHQLIPITRLVVKDPGPATSRKIVLTSTGLDYLAFFADGNPVAGGATLRMQLDGTTRCYDLPASNWAPAGSATQDRVIGWRYRDADSAHGPVRSVLIWDVAFTPMKIKVVLAGKAAPIDIVPPGVQADVLLWLAGTPELSRGPAEYCWSTAGGRVVRNTARVFAVKDAPEPAACALTACSASGAFLDEQER